MVNQRMLGLGTARSVIRELFEYGKIRAAQVGAENVFDFSLGNPSVPCPQEVNDTAVRILREQPEVIHCYTSAQGDQEARQRFADSLNRRFGTCYTADQFYITVGAAASLCCVFNGLTCPGDEFVVFAPYFPEYKVFIEGAGAKMVLIPPEIEGFQIDFDAFEAAISEHTKGVVVNSPNNPSGVVYSRETLERLSAILTEKSRAYGHPIYLISDEPYREIVFSGFQVPWIPQLYPDTIVCYSFSKSLSLPGERLGYVLVPAAVTDSREVYAAVAGAGRSLGYVNAPACSSRSPPCAATSPPTWRSMSATPSCWSPPCGRWATTVWSPAAPSTSSPAPWSPTIWPSASGPSSSICCWSPAPASAPPATCASPTASRPT